MRRIDPILIAECRQEACRRVEARTCTRQPAQARFARAACSRLNRFTGIRGNRSPEGQASENSLRKQVFVQRILTTIGNGSVHPIYAADELRNRLLSLAEQVKNSSNWSMKKYYDCPGRELLNRATNLRARSSYIGAVSITSASAALIWCRGSVKSAYTEPCGLRIQARQKPARTIGFCHARTTVKYKRRWARICEQTGFDFRLSHKESVLPVL